MTIALTTRLTMLRLAEARAFRQSGSTVKLPVELLGFALMGHFESLRRMRCARAPKLARIWTEASNFSFSD